PCTNKGYFDYDSSNVRPDAEAVLRQFGTWMIQHGESTLTVEGHADERGTREYNLALAARRAEAAKKYLIAMGVDGGRIKTISYGKERPDDPRSNQDAWARNRRFVALQIDQ
ncbi:MAG: OmpA family protein, partial [Alphaproteobacteria bacterium]|nr:OmpA family protein [Alphaproteobacteria bacterium]